MRRVRSSLLIVSFIAVCFSGFPLSAGTVPSLSGSFQGGGVNNVFILSALDGTSPEGAFGFPVFPSYDWQGLCNFGVDPCDVTYGGSFASGQVVIGMFPYTLTLYGLVTQGGYSGFVIYDPTTGFTDIEETGSFDFVGTWVNNFGVDTGWTGVGSVSYDYVIGFCNPRCETFPPQVLSGNMLTTTTPEASALLLFGSALMTAAGVLRRKYSQR